jgi:hypothetical protein
MTTPRGWREWEAENAQLAAAVAQLQPGPAHLPKIRAGIADLESMSPLFAPGRDAALAALRQLEQRAS